MNTLETKGLYKDFSGLKILFDVNLQVKGRRASRRYRAERGRQDDALQRDYRNL